MEDLKRDLDDGEQLLFASLLSTSLITALIGGISANSSIAWHAISTIGTIVLAAEFAIYGLWSRSKDFGVSLLIALIALWGPIQLQQPYLYILPALGAVDGIAIAIKKFRLKKEDLKWVILMGLAGAILSISMNET